MAEEVETKTIKLCHCGNGPENHSENFRHKFEPIINVKISLDNRGEIYTVNALEYPEKIKKKCRYCTNYPFVHKTEGIKHDYEQVEIKYRELNFIVPWNTCCRICRGDLRSHLGHIDQVGGTLEQAVFKNINTHTFTVKIVVENKGEHDILIVNDPEYDDTKIVIE